MDYPNLNNSITRKMICKLENREIIIFMFYMRKFKLKQSINNP